MYKTCTDSFNQEEAEKTIHQFKSILENENIIKIGQNIKFDQLVLKWYDIDVKGILFDTVVNKRVVNAGIHV